MHMLLLTEAVTKAVRRYPALECTCQLATLVLKYKRMLRSKRVAEELAQLGASLFTSTSLNHHNRGLVILPVASSFESGYGADQCLEHSQCSGVTDEYRRSIDNQNWWESLCADDRLELLTFVVADSEKTLPSDADIPWWRGAFNDCELVDAALLVGAQC